MRRIFLSAWLLLSLSLSAALPPLSQEQREEYASDIISGKVVNIAVSERTKFEGVVDYVYDAEILVAEVAKTVADREVKVGDTIHVHYWKQKERPRGWAGPGGQYHLLEVGMDARAYMFRDSEGTLRLLEPNGSDDLAVSKNP